MRYIINHFHLSTKYRRKIEYMLIGISHLSVFHKMQLLYMHYFLQFLIPYALQNRTIVSVYQGIQHIVNKYNFQFQWWICKQQLEILRIYLAIFLHQCQMMKCFQCYGIGRTQGHQFIGELNLKNILFSSFFMLEWLYCAFKNVLNINGILKRFSKSFAHCYTLNVPRFIFYWIFFRIPKNFQI